MFETILTFNQSIRARNNDYLSVFERGTAVGAALYFIIDCFHTQPSPGFTVNGLKTSSEHQFSGLKCLICQRSKVTASG